MRTYIESDTGRVKIPGNIARYLPQTNPMHWMKRLTTTQPMGSVSSIQGHSSIQGQPVDEKYPSKSIKDLYTCNYVSWPVNFWSINRIGADIEYNSWYINAVIEWDPVMNTAGSYHWLMSRRKGNQRWQKSRTSLSVLCNRRSITNILAYLKLLDLICPGWYMRFCLRAGTPWQTWHTSNRKSI